METTIKALKDKLNRIKRKRLLLTDGQRRTLASYKGMTRNAREEGHLGGESGISPAAITQAHQWADKVIAGLAS